MLPEYNGEATPQNPKPHSLLFKPRQVLLFQRRNTTTTTAAKETKTMKNNEEQITLNPDQKSLLLSSVLCYLNNNGFDKPLKRLISAANIQDEKWKACSLNLEDMLKHYIETCSNSCVDAKLNTSKAKAYTLYAKLLSNGTKKDENDHSSEEVIVKKKKKKGSESENIPAVAEDIEVKTKKKSKKAFDSVEEIEKDKKKKSKHKSEPLESNIESTEEVKSKDKKKKSKKSAKSDGEADVEGESKDKKKPKKKQNLDSSIEKAEKPLEGEAASEKFSNGVAEVANKEGIKEDKSKKRKRSDSDEKDDRTPLTKGGESTGNKSRSKDNNGSAEPKSETAFQRVKIEEVKFADERLQDNSYWAKDGADVGYGAKAQDVLGQVRGRDFRHENTKKKRVSYRGGQIDLYSHSVKFNYEEED